MICARVCFALVIREDFLSWAMFELEFLVDVAVEEPKVSHFHASGLLALDGVVYYSYGCRIIDVNGRWWLWVS